MWASHLPHRTQTCRVAVIQKAQLQELIWTLPHLINRKCGPPYAHLGAPHIWEYPYIWGVLRAQFTLSAHSLSRLAVLAQNKRARSGLTDSGHSVCLNRHESEGSKRPIADIHSATRQPDLVSTTTIEPLRPKGNWSLRINQTLQFLGGPKRLII